MSTTQPAGSVAAPHETLPQPVQAFRLVIALAQELRTLMDQRLLTSGITTQQAALMTVIEILGRPALGEAARALATSHQNVKQLASALERKGFIAIVGDEHDARSKRLVATARQRAFWARRNPDDHADVARWLSNLDDTEMAVFVGLLAKAMDGARTARMQPTAAQSSAQVAQRAGRRRLRCAGARCSR